MPSNDPLFDDGNSEIAGRTGSRAKINSELPTIRELLGAKEGVNLFAKSVGILRLLSSGSRLYSGLDHVSFMSWSSTALALRIPSLLKLAVSLCMNFS